MHQTAECREILFAYNPIHIAVLFFWIAVLIGTLRSILPHHSFWGTYTFYFQSFCAITSFIIVFVLVSQHVSDTDRSSSIFSFMTYMIASGGVVALYGFLQRIGLDFIRWERATGYRVNASLGNPNFLGAFIGMIIPLVCVMLCIVQKRFKKWSLAALILFMFFVLTHTFSRGAWIGTIMGCIVCAIGVGRHVIRKHIRYFIVIIGICIMYIVISQGVVHMSKRTTPLDRALAVFDLKEQGIASRIAGYHIAADIIKRTPFFGTGLDTFGILFRQHLSEDYLVYAHNLVSAGYVHNEFLQYAVDLGIIGLGIYVWVLVSFYIVAVRVIRMNRDKPLTRMCASGIMGAVTGAVIQGQFSFNILTTALYMWVLIGCMGALLPQSSFQISVRPKEFLGRLFSHSFLIRFPVGKRFFPLGYAGIGIILICILFLFKAYFSLLRADYFFYQSKAYLYHNKPLKALTMLELAHHLDERSDVYAVSLGKEYLSRARNTHNDNQSIYIEKALTLLNSQRQSNPFHALTYNALGAAYLALYNIDHNNPEILRESMRALRQALILDPFLGSAYLNQGIVYERLNQQERAFLSYQRALELDPHSTSAHFNIGVIYANRKDYEKARYHWEAVLRMNPDHKKAREYITVLSALNRAKE